MYKPLSCISDLVKYNIIAQLLLKLAQISWTRLEY